MAVIEKGVITEEGPTDEVFLNPQSDTAKVFIDITNNLQISKEKEVTAV